MNFGIIAAGEGSRLRTEGVEVWKPMVEIDGQPMIGRLIHIFEDCGANSINVVVNGNMPEVQEYVDNLVPTPGCIIRSKSAVTPSSMHTFNELVSMIGPDAGKFIVTTVDTIFLEESFKTYVKAFREEGREVDGLMAVTKYIEDEKPLYVATGPDGYITGFLDAPSEGVEYVSAGIYGLDSKALPVLSECLEKGVNRMRNFQRALIEAGLRLKAFDMGKVLDVDHASDIEVARRFVSENSK